MHQERYHTMSTQTETRYNGWSSYATWRVNLELIDDYVASFVGETGVWSDVTSCADNLEQYVDECLTNYGDIPDDNLALSYARAFVSNVDYREIAETIKTDNPELFGPEDAHHYGAYCECPECVGEV